MRPYLERPVANPSSQHGPGRAARAAVETAREQVAAMVGADPAQVIFTSGGTEADNLAVKGTVLLREPGERHLVVSAVEHHAVLDAAEWAVVDACATVALAPVDGVGRVDLGRLGELIEPGRTALVALMAANNEVGTLQPVAVAERGTGAGALARLRERLLDGLRAVEPGLQVNGDPGTGLPGLLSVRLPGRRSEDVLLLLDRGGVACSAGSACASGATGASHVLLAMDRTPVEARETIRLSLGHGPSEADVDAAVAAFRHAVAVLDAGRSAAESAGASHGRPAPAGAAQAPDRQHASAGGVP